MYTLLLVPLQSKSPCLRLHILWLSQRLWLLRHSFPLKAYGWLPTRKIDHFLRAHQGVTSFPIFRLTLVLGFSLFTGFIVSTCWSVANQPTTYPFPFGTSLPAFWLVLHYDDLVKRFVFLSMTSYARRDSALG